MSEPRDEEKDIHVVKQFRVVDDLSLVDAAANKAVFLAVKSADGEVDEWIDVSDKVWEEGPGEIRHRLRDPGDFREDTFRRMAVPGASGITMILGKLKPANIPAGHKPMAMVVQALRFSKEKFDMTKAKAWMAGHQEIGKEEHWEDEAGKSADDEDMSLARRFVAGLAKIVGRGSRDDEKDTPQEEENMGSENKNAEAKTAEPDVIQRVTELEATVVGLQEKLKAKDEEVAGLQGNLAEQEKAAHRQAVTMKVDGYIKDQKLMPALREHALAAMLQESVTGKATDGTDLTIEPATAIEKLIEASKGIPLGEVTKAATSPDTGKFDGKTPKEYAEASLKKAGYLPSKD